MESPTRTSEREESYQTDHFFFDRVWVEDLLKDYYGSADFLLKDYKISEGSADENSLSDIIAVKIRYERNDQKHTLELIIKLLPSDPFIRYFIYEAEFDFREIKFYDRVLPDLLEFQTQHLCADAEPMTIAVPKCYTHVYQLSDDFMRPPKSMLVLQDMRPLGYQSAHFTSGLTLAESKYAIISIAAVHALSLAMKFKGNIDMNEKYPFLFQIDNATSRYQQLVEQSLPHLKKFLTDFGDKDQIVQSLDRMRGKTKNIIKSVLEPSEPMGLITHTDFWSNNLLLKTQPDKNRDDNCVILDWQMITYSRATNDIALLITSSLASEVRREYTESLLDFYYECLKKNLSKVNVDLEEELHYSREKLDIDYKKSQLLSLLLCIGSVDIVLGEQDAEQRLIDVLEDFYDEGILTVNYLESLDFN